MAWNPAGQSRSTSAVVVAVTVFCKARNSSLVRPVRTCNSRGGFLCQLARIERDSKPLANRDVLTGPWISALSGLPFLYFEDAEVAEFDAAFLSQDLDDRVECLLNGQLCFQMCAVQFVGNATDDVSFGHGVLLG
ncbi:MAG: hypothetical protein ABSG53_25220 [Thermoguttaceae bacterium]